MKGNSQPQAAAFRQETPLLSAAQQYARSLGVDPAFEPDLVEFVHLMLQMPLPTPWKECVDPKQRVFYWNPLSRRSSWAHPCSTTHSALVAAYRRIVSAPDRTSSVQAEIDARHAQGEAELALWCEVPSSTGEPYYIHSKTKATRWDNPRHEMSNRLQFEAQLLAKLAEADVDLSPKSGGTGSVAEAVAAAAQPLAISPNATFDVLAAACNTEDPGDADLMSHPVLKELQAIFERCDVRSDGRLSKLALATVCQRSPRVCEFFRLPREIRPDDGSRDALEWFFHLLGLGGTPDIDWEDFQAFYANRLLEIRAFGDTTVEEEQLLNNPHWCANVVLNAGATGFAESAGHTGSSFAGRQQQEANMWATLPARVQAAAAAAAAEGAARGIDAEETPGVVKPSNIVGQGKVESDLSQQSPASPRQCAMPPPGLPRPVPVAGQKAVASPAGGMSSGCEDSPEIDAEPPPCSQAVSAPIVEASQPSHATAECPAPTAAPKAKPQSWQPSQKCCLEADDFASTMLVGLFPVRRPPSRSSVPVEPVAATVASQQPALVTCMPAAAVQQEATEDEVPKAEDSGSSEMEFEDDFESDDEAGSAAADADNASAGQSPKCRPCSVGAEEASAGDTGGTTSKPVDLPAELTKQVQTCTAMDAAASQQAVDLLAALPQEVLSPFPAVRITPWEAALGSIAVPWPLGLEPPCTRVPTLAVEAAADCAELHGLSDEGEEGDRCSAGHDADSIVHDRLSSAAPSAAKADHEQHDDSDLNPLSPGSGSGVSLTASVMMAAGAEGDTGAAFQVSDETIKEFSEDKDEKIDCAEEVEEEVIAMDTERVAPSSSLDAFLNSLAEAAADFDSKASPDTWAPRLLRMESVVKDEQAPLSLPAVQSESPARRLCRPQLPHHDGDGSIALSSKRRRRPPAKRSYARFAAGCAVKIACEKVGEAYSEDGFDPESDEEHPVTVATSSPVSAPVGTRRSAHGYRQSDLAAVPDERLVPRGGARRAAEAPVQGRESRPLKAYSHDARRAYRVGMELLPNPAPPRHRAALEPPLRENVAAVSPSRARSVSTVGSRHMVGQSSVAPQRPVRGKVGVRGTRSTRKAASAVGVPGSLAYSLQGASNTPIVKSCPTLPARVRVP